MPRQENPRISSCYGGWAHYTIEDAADGGARLVLSGPFLVATIGGFDEELLDLPGPFSAVDIAGIDEIDTAGAWFVSRIASDHQTEITGGSDRAKRLIKAVEEARSPGETCPERVPVWERVPERAGEMVFHGYHGFRGIVAFLGALTMAFGSLIRHPRRFRIKALVRQMELIGIASLPIIGLMSFLIGIVIAQQGAVQLQQFGAETLTVNLVGRISLRELGVLMTAIMVAGRSGSAFAAQIGTMKLTEEIDAMRTIGISPMEALVVPRVLACTFMMILLGFYASFVTIVGGAVIGDLMLGIPFLTFLMRIQEVVPTYDLWVGLIKAPVFGLIVALAGCYQGMQVEGNSEEVGLRTTKAVVYAIFAVIVIDAFFAVFFTNVGWG